jgi:glycosyltransferase involved in cell wall biosynthesis
MPGERNIAVLVPCLNEERTIGKVVRDFKVALPSADIYVYDNASTDSTAAEALRSGAVVRTESRRGKGNVVRSMFRDIEADIYVMVDGDDTYSAADAKKLLSAVVAGADMVVGDRNIVGQYGHQGPRRFHLTGNLLVRTLVRGLFKSEIYDIMSGYRAFSRRFVKNYPVLFGGFQLETDMTVFASHRFLSVREIPVKYRERKEGENPSKLRTYSDGLAVILAIVNLYRYYRPFAFFSFLAIVFALSGLASGTPVLIEYIETHYILRVPLAILASSLVAIGVNLFVSGILSDTVHRSQREAFETDIRRKS